MEFFQKAKVVKLRGHHNKYLWAEDDECMISQSRDGSKRNALWTVEQDNENRSLLKLKSCFDCYLTATNVPYLFGMTGKKVLQMKLVDSESFIAWEPIREGFSVKLKTPSGHYLRANGTIPPWRNSVTHDVPHRSATQDWVLWEVVPVESSGDGVIPEINSPLSPKSPGIGSFKEHSSHTPKVKLDGRTIYFAVADDDGEVPEDFDLQFLFKGSDLSVLTEKLKEETGITEEIVVCSRNLINNKLYPLRLQLPPNNTPMYVVVVKASSRAAKTLQASPLSSELEPASFNRLPSFDDDL